MYELKRIKANVKTKSVTFSYHNLQNRYMKELRSHLFMRLYQLVHTIKSPKTIRKLEGYLSSHLNILSYETEVGCHCYEIETRIRKKELIKLLGSFIKELSITKNERVVLYDPSIQSELFELPKKNEKIILNGDIEKENQVEEIILEIFRYIQIKMELEKTEKMYFSSLLVNKKPRID